MGSTEGCEPFEEVCPFQGQAGWLERARTAPSATDLHQHLRQEQECLEARKDGEEGNR